MIDTPKRRKGYSAEEVETWRTAIMALVDEGKTWTEIAKALDVHATTLLRWRYRLGLS